MNDLWILYWLTRLDSINGALFVAILLCGIALIITAIHFGSNDEPIVNKYTKVLSIALLIVVPALILIPTQKDAMLIIAGSKVMEAARSDTAGRIAGKSVEAFEKLVDSYLKKEKTE